MPVMSVENLKKNNQIIVKPKKNGLLVENPVYEPFRYHENNPLHVPSTIGYSELNSFKTPSEIQNLN